MRLRSSLFFNCLILVALGASSVEAASAAGEAAVPASKEKTTPLVIHDGPNCGEAKVEEGSAVIKGKPAKSESSARKSWERACRKWQRHLRRLNGSNLMIDDCGEPSSTTVSRSEDTQQILFESKAIYKIKLGCP